VITCASGRLKIAGLLWRPTDTTGKRVPLLIVLRGGNNRFNTVPQRRFTLSCRSNYKGTSALFP
jgi:hypothetical protein